MFYKMSIRKIFVSLCALFAMTLIYLIQKEIYRKYYAKYVKEFEYLIPKEESFKQELEYVKENVVFSDIYLIDSYNYVSLTQVVVKETDTLSKAKTDIDGKAVFKDVPYGEYAIIVKKDKFVAKPRSVSVSQKNVNTTLFLYMFTR